MRKCFKTIWQTLFATALIVVTITSTTGLLAQPSNYCSPYCPEGYASCSCMSSYAYFTEVRMTNIATGEVVLQRTSGEDGCFIFIEDREARMEPGVQYNLYLRRYNLITTNRTFVYIDWNKDGDFMIIRYLAIRLLMNVHGLLHNLVTVHIWRIMLYRCSR